MPTSNKGGATRGRGDAGGGTVGARQRAVRELAAKAKASRTQAATTEARAQQVNDKPKQRPMTGVEKALGFRTVQAGVPSGAAMHLGARTLGDLADAAIHAPAGIYQTGKAVTKDVGATRHGDLSFKRSRALAKALAQGTAQDFEHPLRHPGFTGLDLLAVASAGAGAAGRAGAVARAAKAGEVGEAAKAIVRRPMAGTRTYKIGDLEVKTPNSRNTLVRQVQKLHAKRVNASGNEARQSRIAGKHLHMNDRVIEAANRADAGALRSAGKKLTTPQETALRVVAEGKPIDERIAFHKQQLQTAKAQERRDHQQKIALLHAAKRYVQDVNGTPHLNPRFARPLLNRLGRGATSGELQDVYQKVEKVAARREQVLEKVGKLGPAQIESRQHGPGRVIGGATFERTPAVKGRREQVREYPGRSKTISRERTVEEAKAKLAELDAKYEKAIQGIAPHVNPFADKTAMRNEQLARNRFAGGRKVGGKRHAKKTLVSAEVRALAEDKLLALAEKHPHQQFAKEIAERARLQEALNEHALPDTSFRGQHTSPDAKGGVPMHDLAGGHVYPADIYDKSTQARYHGHGDPSLDHPTFAIINHLRGKPDADVTVYRGVPGDVHKINPGDWVTPNRRYAEEHAASEDGWHVIGTKVKARDLFTNGDSIHEWGWHPAPPLGTVSETIPGKPRRVHLREVKAQRAAARLVGDEGFKGGRLRIPYNATALRPNVHFPGKFAGGTPKVPGSLTHEFTGGLLKHANFRDKTTALVSESGLEAERYASVLRRRDQILKAARDTRPNEDGWVPVRTGEVSKISPRVQQLMWKNEEGVKLSGAEKHELSRSFDDWRKHVFPDESSLSPEEFKGVKWVRQELLKKLNQPRLLAPLGQQPSLRMAGTAMREINATAKGAMLYLAPKYAVPNVLGNTAMALVQQGFAAPMNLARASALTLKGGRELAGRVDAMMGEGFVRSFGENVRSGPASAVTNKLAGVWGKVVDVPFRRAAFIHEARQAGFKSPQALNRLLTDEAHREKLVEVTQRAWEAIGDYERMNATEKEIVRNVVFFYPWLKVSSRYSKHFVTEHPIKAAATAQMGKQGEAQQRKDLGNVPSFAEGLFKVGGTRQHPLVSNPSSANIFTSADIVKTIGNFVHGRRSQSGYQPTGMLTPALSMAITELTGRDPFTQQQVKGNPAQVAGNAVFGGLPQPLLKQRLARVGTDQSDKMYTYTKGQALGQFTLGPLGPRGYNKSLGEGIAKKEHLGDVAPVERSYRKVFERRQAFYTEMQRLHKLENGRMPETLRKAFDLEAERQGDYAAATEKAKAKAGTPAYHLARLEADTKFLSKYQQIPPAEAKQIVTWARAHPRDIEKLKQARRYLSDNYYRSPSGFLTLINDSKKYLETQGAKGLG